jgi:hypothetical protein
MDVQRPPQECLEEKMTVYWKCSETWPAFSRERDVLAKHPGGGSDSCDRTEHKNHIHSISPPPYSLFSSSNSYN